MQNLIQNDLTLGFLSKTIFPTERPLNLRVYILKVYAYFLLLIHINIICHKKQRTHRYYKTYNLLIKSITKNRKYQ